MSTRTATTRARTTTLVVQRKAAAAPGGDIRTVAIASIDTVADISRTVIVKDKSAASFCRSLRGVLWTIKAHLEKQRDGPCEVTDDRKKLESFLNNLERLCAWPLSVKGEPANPWPALKAAKFAAGKANAVECVRKFATDETLSDRRAEIIKRLEKFGSKSLRKETAEVTQKVEVPASQGPANPSHELDDDIEHLLKILRQYGSCHTDGNCCDISTNIRLNGYRALGTGRQGKKTSALTEFIADNASAEFGVLFLDHPHATDGFWQEASIQICQPLVAKAPLIRFADDEVHLSALEAAASAHQTLLSCETFCKHISSRGQDLLRLSARDDEFLYHKRADATRDWLAQHDAMPLSLILTRPGMNLYDKSKAILEFLVARATWQFYTSDAIGQGLTSDSVYFVHEQRLEKNGVFVNEPMLLMKLQEVVSDSRDQPTVVMIHDMPKILSLGIVLLELETRKSMRKHRENSKLCPPGQFNINTDYRIASNLVDDGPYAHPESILSEIDPRSPLRRILPLCIKAGHLRSKVQQNLSARKKGNNSKVDINESNALRATIYSEIVQPLEQWANKYDDLERVKPLYELADAPTPRMPAPQQLAGTAVLRPNATNKSGDQQLRNLSRQWFEKYEKLSRVLQPLGTEAAGQAYRETKIAVLDTGIHLDDYEYYKEVYARIDYADLVESAPSPCDNTGHGSTAVSLLVRACPNASLHIARVLKSNLATVRDVSTVVKGIDWAIAQKVDIISMAIGFESEHQPLVEAIGRAHAQGILIFSAASNGRNIDPVYCPAIITDQVFGMFSTNAGVRESASINPSPLDASANFAIFGEDVEIHEDAPLLRGTSYSTSIGAGVAAALLDFSRQGHDGNLGRLSGFRGRQQMKRVLLEMSASDGNYDCIRPWKLLNSDPRHAENRSEQREWIRGTIERLMQPENLYGRQRR